MKKLSFNEFAAQSKSFDEAVESMSGIDHYCSASDWILPASQALMPERESWIHAANRSYWAFMRGRHPEGFYYLEPLEAMWALACPMIGAQVDVLMEGLEILCEQPKEDWKILVISGLPSEHPIFAAIVQRFASRLRLGLGQETTRLTVDLSGGVDAFLARRSKQFRRSLKRTIRNAAQAGITIVDASQEEPDAIFSRIMDVESRGWKGLESMGINDGPMHFFYQAMLPRLSSRGAGRVLFAQQGERDIAYIFGGIRKETYRGLQFSFDAEYKPFGLGNLLQAEQISRLCEEKVANYDLGTHMDYKTRWSDNEQETLTVLLMRD